MSFNALAICLDDSNNKKQPLIGLATLMTLLFAGEDLTPIGAQLIALAGGDDAEALLDLSVLVQLKGDRDTGLALQQQALMLKQHYKLEPENLNSQIKLLAIMAPGDLMTNTPLEFITEGLGMNLEMLYVSEEYPLPKELPEHDIIMVAVSELDRNHAILKSLEMDMKNYCKPIINKPQNIAAMARDRTSIMLQKINGINMPITSRINRSELEAINNSLSTLSTYLNGSDFPIIIRPIDSHAGSGLQKLESINDISDYLTNQANENYFISPFINYHSDDKQYRKYRIVLIKGKPFIVHMAIAEQWMVHYANAGMAENASKRAEEQFNMETFDEGFSKRHVYAFQKIYQRLDLDYIGIDCAETIDGDLLIFEIGNSLTVHSLDPVDIFPYKKTQITKVFNGFETLLEQTLTSSTNNKSLELIKV